MKSSIEIESDQNQHTAHARKRKKQFLVLGALLLASIIVIAAIVLAVIFLSDNDGSPQPAPLVDERDPFSLEDVLRGRLQARRFNGTWIDDTTFHYFDLLGNLVMYDVKTGKSNTILSERENPLLIGGFLFEFSADKKFLLIAQARRKIFRHSFIALYSIYDLETNQITNIKINNEQVPLRLVKWNPVDHSMIINYNNNLYYKKSPTSKEIQITFDGDPSICNGVPDWVYEEEVFSTNSATWYSPDGKKIVFIKFNDTNVPVMPLSIYGEPGNPDYQYPHNIHLHYPKVSTKNPIVSLHYVNLEELNENQKAETKEIVVPSKFQNAQQDHLITSVSFAKINEFMVMWMNRIQNQGILKKCTITQEIECIDAETFVPTDGWVEFFSEPFYNKDGTQMAYIGSYQMKNSTDSYRQVLMMDLKTYKIVPLGLGPYVVNEIVSWNKDNNYILFKANIEGDSRVSHLFAVKGEENAQKICLTCNLGNQWKNYSYFDVEFAKNGESLALISLGPLIPRTDIMEIEYKMGLDDVQLKHVLEWETNPELHEITSHKKTPLIMYDDIELDNGWTSKVLMFYPPDLDKTKKHPMLIEVYGGPDSSMVTTKWSLDWGSGHLVSNLSIIYAKIDGRGSGLRGDKVLNAIYRKLGSVEIEDQIATAKKLQQKYQFIDETRTAIWGWSYGGYASAMSLAKDTQKVFKCAISVAPVTDWTLYDSIYTERYMDLRENNENAYENSRLTKLATGLKNKKYLLVHGTLDDNVHYQQAMLLARVLEQEDIAFDQISYPDEDHSLVGVRPHLYHSLGRFINNCFDIKR
jgi:dipeptidyl-peptidase-4